MTELSSRKKRGKNPLRKEMLEGLLKSGTTEIPRWLNGKESAFQCRRCMRLTFDPWVRKMPWRRKWQPTPVFLPVKSHGKRSLMDYSPWRHKESDRTEHMHRATE